MRFVLVNGMWVSNCSIGELTLSEYRGDKADPISDEEIAWLRTKFASVQVYLIEMTEL